MLSSRKAQVPKEKPKYPVNPYVGAGGEEQAFNGGKIEKVTDPGMAEAKAELDAILKKSPVIIISKSHCPFSRRAKTLLLDTYSIVPAPYVVELDQLTKPMPRPTSADSDDSPPETLGRKLQDLLEELTGRKTVPNILVNARSIGGSDDIAKLDKDGLLIEEIKKYGGKKITEIEKRG